MLPLVLAKLPDVLQNPFEALEAGRNNDARFATVPVCKTIAGHCVSEAHGNICILEADECIAEVARPLAIARWQVEVVEIVFEAQILGDIQYFLMRAAARNVSDHEGVQGPAQSVIILINIASAWAFTCELIVAVQSVCLDAHLRQQAARQGRRLWRLWERVHLLWPEVLREALAFIGQDCRTTVPVD